MSEEEQKVTEQPEGANEKKPDADLPQSEANLYAAISYVSILSVVIYVLKKENEYISFHSRQAMVVFGLSLFFIIPVLGWLISLGALLLMIIGGLKAYKGEKFKIPVIYDIAKKIDF